MTDMWIMLAVFCLAVVGVVGLVWFDGYFHKS